ncbi:unnamed protein product [Merluccius merluccius]
MRCRDKTNDRQYAVKEFVQLSEREMRETIAIEFELLSTLKHDNLIQVVSKFEQGGLLYCVFELMDHSIADDINLQPEGLESQLMRKYMFQTLRGLNYLHSVNVLHRDMKPDNLLVSHSGVVKVADLCSSRVVNANKGEKLTTSVGTLRFLSPEALTGDHFYSMSHDVWAFGCTVLDMANHIKFDEEAGGTCLGQVLMVVRTVEQQQQGFHTKYPMFWLPVPALLPTDPQQKYKLSDPLLAQLIEACLQMEPDSRATCSELLNHEYFTWDSFHQRFPQELTEIVLADQQLVHEHSSQESIVTGRRLPRGCDLARLVVGRVGGRMVVVGTIENPNLLSNEPDGAVSPSRSSTGHKTDNLLVSHSGVVKLLSGECQQT